MVNSRKRTESDQVERIVDREGGNLACTRSVAAVRASPFVVVVAVVVAG